MKRILLDTDLAMGSAGSHIDDGFALAFALAEPEIAVDLVTTVAGNVDVDTATACTLELLRMLGSSTVPVVRGAGKFLRAHSTSPRAAATEATTVASGATAGRAAEHIVRRVTAEPGAYTIVAIGPLTNIATALLLAPEMATAVEEIVVMGGMYLGATNRAAMPGEFNFSCDPDAVAIVLESGAALRFVGLDVTTRVRLTSEHTARLRSSGSEFGAFAADTADEAISAVAYDNPGDARLHGGCSLHDPLAVAVVTHPQLVTWRDAHVSVETASPLTRGVAIADLLTTADPPPPNCRIAVDVDAAQFIDLFLERVSRW